MGIFKKREHIIPYEYPQLLAYKDAIRHSYWLHTEFNLTNDISDYRTKLTKPQQEAVKRTMLAISQIEVSVKTFWSDLYKRMPITEVGDVGMTFGESEVRHKDSYSFILDKLGLQKEFRTILEVPAIQGRIKYLEKYLSGTRSRDNKMFTKSVLLFSLFIENVSLFSQFLIIMSINKELNLLSGLDNIVQATSLEETIHGQFGTELINIIKTENPEWFDEDFEKLIKSAVNKAFKAECDMLDWIFEQGELQFLPKANIQEFIKNRFNQSLNSIGYSDVFEIKEDLISPSLWFDVKLTSKKEVDIFHKRSVDYTKKTKSITADDLF